MKALRTLELDGFEIVLSVSDPICDPMATKIAAKERLGGDATYREIIREMVRAPEYFENVRGQENISDDEAEKLEVLIHKADRYERVTRAGEIIADNRGRTWCKFDGGEWTIGEIEQLGAALPDGAVWRVDLSVSQLRSIHEQLESEKIAMLSPESRVQVAEIEIQAAKRAAVIKRMEAEIVNEVEGLENARQWYRCEITRIHQKYNLPRAKGDDES